MKLSELRPGMVIDNPTPNMPVGVVLGQGYVTDGQNLPVLITNRSPMLSKRSLRVKDVPARHIFAGGMMNTGADPEVFAVDKNGKIIPAFEFLPDKKHAIVVDDPKNLSSGAAVFYDGFQAEFTVQYGGCHGFITDNVRFGLETVWREAQKHNPTAKLTINSVLPIPLETRITCDPAHLRLGCAPSENVYRERPIAVPAPEALEVRFAGAHMHFGGATNPENLPRTVKLLDAIVGVATVAMGEGYNCPERRKYYGRAGEYRFHPSHKYHNSRLEYRVPDTVLLSHPATYNLILDFARVVWRMGIAGLEFLWDASEDEVRQAINEYDVKLARKILEHNRTILERILEKANPAWGASTEEWVEAGIKLFFEGIGSVVADPQNVVENWWLDREYVPDPPPGAPPQDKWFRESMDRQVAYWHTGRIWSSAAKLVMEGKKV